MVDAPDDDDLLPAGAFSAWLTGLEAALDERGESDVPCDGCTACCTSSQFIHVRPDDVDARAHIPAELLFPAPFLPAGDLLLGYDERGHCPMLLDGACTIYAHRPRTCRTYDCRVLAAADVSLGDDPDKADIAQRATRWRFDHATADDRAAHDAVQAAATFLADHADELTDGPVPATARAVLAVEVHEAFLDRDPTTGRWSVVTPGKAEVAVAVRARRRAR